MEELVRQMLVTIGEDPDREGLEKTPSRVAAAYDYMTRGYHQSLDDLDALRTRSH